MKRKRNQERKKKDRQIEKNGEKKNERAEEPYVRTTTISFHDFLHNGNSGVIGGTYLSII